MTESDKNFIRNTMKTIANSERKHVRVVHKALDAMAVRFGIVIPCRRNGKEDRRIINGS